MSKNSVFMGVALLISILLTTMVYAAFSTQLTIEGKAIVRSEQNIRITNISISNTSNGAYETYNSKYNKDVTFMYVTLPAHSSISYDVEITSKNDYINDIAKINQESHTNPNVNISISLNVGDMIEANSKKTFTITLTNNTESEQKETLVYQYIFMKHYTVDYSSPKEYVFTAPYDGIYKLETWGAQGGSVSSTYRGGYGGYATGVVKLNKYQTIYVVVGGQGKGATSMGQTLEGGYNGGGTVFGNSEWIHITGSGGGATHIATTTGLLSTLSSNRSSALIVAGGGGGGRDQSNHIPDARWGIGGNGGGYIAGGTMSSNGSTSTLTTVTTVSGTQTSGYSFGIGENANGQSAGGGGWYGGYSGTRTSVVYTGSGGGGSGYIANTLLTNKAMYCYNCQESSEESTKTISTTCVSESPTANCAKQGNGAAKITLVKRIYE